MKMYFVQEFLNGADPTSFFLWSVYIYSAIAVYIVTVSCVILKHKLRAKRDKMYYIVLNIQKSVVLFVIALIFGVTIMNGSLNPFTRKGMVELRLFMVNLACLYSITDISSLVLNYRMMKWSTIVHHVAVAFAYYSIARADFTQEGIYMGMMMYGAYSSLAFPVNTYLGARSILSKRSTWYLKKVALVSYVVACGLNWIWQAYYMALLAYLGWIEGNYINFAKICVLATMIYAWMKDDLILIAHLKKNN